MNAAMAELKRCVARATEGGERAAVGCGGDCPALGTTSISGSRVPSLVSQSAPSNPSSPTPRPWAVPSLLRGSGTIVALVRAVASYFRQAHAAAGRGLGKCVTCAWSRTAPDFDAFFSMCRWVYLPLIILGSVRERVEPRVAAWAIYAGLIAREVKARGDWALPVNMRTAALTCSLALLLREALWPTPTSAYGGWLLLTLIAPMFLALPFPPN